MTRLFVYGTLKRGFCRDHHLAESRYVGVAETVPQMSLLDCGDYPALVPNGQTSVCGELYDVTEEVMCVLDRVEGVVFGLYARGHVALADGTKAVTYLYTASVDGLPDAGNEWTKRAGCE